MPKLIFSYEPNAKREWEYIKLLFEDSKSTEFLPNNIQKLVKNNDFYSFEKAIKEKINKSWQKHFTNKIATVDNMWQEINDKYFELVAEITDTSWKHVQYKVIVSSVFADCMSDFTKPYGDDICMSIKYIDPSRPQKTLYIIGHELIHTHYWRFGYGFENRNILLRSKINELTNFLIQFKSPLAEVFPGIDFTSLVLGKGITYDFYTEIISAWNTRRSFNDYLEKAVKIANEFYRKRT